MEDILCHNSNNKLKQNTTRDLVKKINILQHFLE